MARLMAIFLFLLSLSTAQAATFTFEADEGEFVFDGTIGGLLSGNGKAVLEADWNAKVAAQGNDFLDQVELQSGVRNFEGYYDFMFRISREAFALEYWRGNGVTVTPNNYYYVNEVGAISAGGASILPRIATITFDVPQHLLYIDVSLGSYWGQGDRIDIVTTTGVGLTTAFAIDVLDISGGNRIDLGAGLGDIKSLKLSAFAPDSRQGMGPEHIFRFNAIGVQTPAMVPLPASLPLLLAGLGGLFAYRRRSA